jgi:hypothetical protein
LTPLPINKIRKNMNKEELAEYDTLWDENIQLYTTLRDTFDALEVIVDLTHKCLDHSEAKEHLIWRNGLLQALATVQEQVAETISTTSKD